MQEHRELNPKIISKVIRLKLMNDKELAEMASADILSLMSHYIIFHGTPIGNLKSPQGHQNIEMRE